MIKQYGCLSTYYQPGKLTNYCIVDPSACHQAPYLPTSHLKCKFCKSLNIINFTTKESHNKFQCLICKCHNDIPASFIQSPVEECPPIYFTDCNAEVSPGKGKTINHEIRVLLLYDTTTGEALESGLYCLADLLVGLGGGTRINCVCYDQSIKMVDLSGEGETYVLNSSCLDLINDNFSEVNELTMNRMIEVLPEVAGKQLTINGSQLLSEIIETISKKTVILWVSSFKEQMLYTPSMKNHLAQIYSFMLIPSQNQTMNLSKYISQVSATSRRLKLIVKSASLEIMTEELHYELYEIFDNLTITNFTVESSRERKYPPEILSRSSGMVGTLRNNIIIHLGVNIQPNQKIQVRLKYTSTTPDQEDEGKLATSEKLLIANIKFQVKNATQQRYRQLALFNLMKKNPGHKQLLNNAPACDIEIDIYRFLRECSMLMRYELMNWIENQNCIFFVWPWIGFNKQSPKLVFYLHGYHYSKGEEDVDHLLSLCQIHHSRRDKFLPVYYSNIVDEINEQLVDSDDEVSMSEMRYYRFDMQSEKESE